MLHLAAPCWAADSAQPAPTRPGGVDPDTSPLVQELLARSKANKEANDKARLDSYYRRNYKEYFEFVEGTVQRGAELGLSDSTKEGIRRWLEANR